MDRISSYLLISRGFDVTVVDYSTSRLETLNPKVKLVQQNILDTKASVFQEQNFVFHCAALPFIQPSFENPLEHERENVAATIDLMTKLRRSKHLHKLVISTSAAVYGNPTEIPTPENAPVDPLSPYALQKYSTEQYGMILGKRYEIPTIALRYFNVYGAGGFNPELRDYSYASVVGLFVHLTFQAKKLTITGDGLQSRDFVHVSDVAQANLMAAESAVNHQLYNVGSGHAVTILELARMFPQEFEFIAKREGEPLHSCADIRKIRHDLRWSPQISLEEGIRRELTHAAVC